MNVISSAEWIACIAVRMVAHDVWVSILTESLAGLTDDVESSQPCVQRPS